MFIALDENKNYILAERAEDGKVYSCPLCKQRVNLLKKNGAPILFVHEPGILCDGFTQDHSDWYKQWVSLFPSKYREVVLSDNGESHRADIVCYGTVVEFMHYPISREEFCKRNNFFTTSGFRVVWVFDATHLYGGRNPGSPMHIKQDWLNDWGYGDIYSWDEPWNLLNGFYPQDERQVHIFFHTIPFGENPTAEDDPCRIVKAVWTSDKGKDTWGTFHVSDKHVFNQAQFLSWMERIHSYGSIKRKRSAKKV